MVINDDENSDRIASEEDMARKLYILVVGKDIESEIDESDVALFKQEKIEKVNLLYSHRFIIEILYIILELFGSKDFVQVFLRNLIVFGDSNELVWEFYSSVKLFKGVKHSFYNF